MPSWSLPETAVGLFVALVFALVAFRDLRWAVLGFTVLGAVPFLQVGALSGNQMVQGLLLVEVLASVLVGVWLIGGRGIWHASRAPFERWLGWLLVVSLLSLASGYFWIDPNISPTHVKLAVSFGQILLLAWPIGIYLVTATAIDDERWLKRFCGTVGVLALPQLVMLLAPATRSYLFWSWGFGLVATPLALAAIPDVRPMLGRVGLLVVAVAPLVEGLTQGKAFLYGYFAVALATVLWLRARTALVGVVAVWLAVVLVMTTLDRDWIPDQVERLVAVERQQSSWGGRNGRVEMALGALDIWSGHPLLGVGPANSYPYLIHRSMIGTPHNQYINILLEFGLAGLAVLLAFVCGVLRYGYRLLRRAEHPFHRFFLTGWLASFTALSVSSLTGDYMFHSIRNGGLDMFSGYYHHWVFLGLAVSLGRMARREQVRPSSYPKPITWTSPTRAA